MRGHVKHLFRTQIARLMQIRTDFKKTYLELTTVDNERRVPPAYPLELWNNFDRIIRHLWNLNMSIHVPLTTML